MTIKNKQYLCRTNEKKKEKKKYKKDVKKWQWKILNSYIFLLFYLSRELIFYFKYKGELKNMQNN